MSDPCGELQVAIRAALKADATIQAIVGAGKPVRVYDAVPTNAQLGPGATYFTIGNDTVIPDLAECIDGSEATATVDIWARSDPLGLALAKALGAAAQMALRNLGDLPSHRLVTAQSLLTRYVIEADGTGHGTLITQFFTEPF